MKNYVSPVIFDNEELAEGVYATGSGSDCWVYTITPGQQETGNPGDNVHVYKVQGDHQCVEHISLWTTTTYSIMPGQPGETVNKVECGGVTVTPGQTGVSSAHAYDNDGTDLGPQFEATLDASGTEYKLTRRCHGNAYAGNPVTDTFDVNVKIYCTFGTCTLEMSQLPYCEHTTNVQGRYD